MLPPPRPAAPGPTSSASPQSVAAAGATLRGATAACRASRAAGGMQQQLGMRVQAAGRAHGARSMHGGLPHSIAACPRSHGPAPGRSGRCWRQHPASASTQGAGSRGSGTPSPRAALSAWAAWRGEGAPSGPPLAPPTANEVERAAHVELQPPAAARAQPLSLSASSPRGGQWQQCTDAEGRGTGARTHTRRKACSPGPGGSALHVYTPPSIVHIASLASKLLHRVRCVAWRGPRSGVAAIPG